MEQAQLLREIIPNPRAHHRECAVLHRRCTGKRDHQNTPLSRAKGSATLGSRPRPPETSSSSSSSSSSSNFPLLEEEISPCHKCRGDLHRNAQNRHACINTVKYAFKDNINIKDSSTAMRDRQFLNAGFVLCLNRIVSLSNNGRTRSTRVSRSGRRSLPT